MHIIGDPHIGREFKANVPLDRRGEREQMMMKEFAKQLITPEKLVVIIGDLFDTPRVPYKYVFETVNMLREAAETHPDKKYVIIAGNHDISPSGAVVGAFEILQLVAEHIPNLHVLKHPTTLCGVVFFPWEWGRTALEQLNVIQMWTDTAIGHWDLVDYGGDTGHLCPAKELHDKGVATIISGHWHLAGDYDINGIKVRCTGSMQPMTHAEDPEGKMYVTLTAEDYARTDGNSFKDKYVRIIVGSGEDVLPPETCLGFKLHHQDEEREEVERVTLGDFDINKILDKHLKEKAVPEPVTKEIKEHLVGIA